AVARDREDGARIEQLTSRGERGAGGEIAGGEHCGDGRPGVDGEAVRGTVDRGVRTGWLRGCGLRGHRPGRGGRERLDVAGREVVEVVDARSAQLDGERDPAAAAQLVAVDPQAQPRCGPGA